MRSWLTRAALPLVLIVLGLVVVGAGCSGVGSSTQTPDPDTYLSFTVAWPQPEASAELIPSGADRVEITIANTGDETPEAVVTIAKADVHAGTATKAVPVRSSVSKEISAQALAADGAILAEAAMAIEVIAGQRTPVALNLVPTSLAYPMIVLATATPAIALPGATITLEGVASDGDGGTIVEYAWDTDGNGAFDYTSATSGTTTVTPANGVYTATFRATDDDGLQATVDVGYQIGLRAPAWSTTPASVDINRKQSSSEQQLEYIPGFPASPCTVKVVGDEFDWTTASEIAGDPTVLRGTFAAADDQWVGTTTAEVVLEDAMGRISDPIQIRFSVRQGFHGFVSNLNDSSATYRNANVTFGPVNTTTGPDGEYLVHGLSAQSARMAVTHPTAITRSFPVDVTSNGAQDVTLLASDFNTFLLRRFLPEAPGGGVFDPGANNRWRPGAPPTFVIYTKTFEGSDVSANMTQIIRNWVENELPTASDGQIGGPGSIEVFSGKPTDDPRYTVYAATGDEWGYINGHNAIALVVVDDYATSGLGGLGGGMRDSQYWLTGGGMTCLASIEDPFIWRHEGGHAVFGWPHPWERMSDSDIPLHMDFSVMNYGPAAAWAASEYSVMDRAVMRFNYHRAPGNLEPDWDPDGMVGYRGDEGTYYGVLHRDPVLSIDTHTTFPSTRFVEENGKIRVLD